MDDHPALSAFRFLADFNRIYLLCEEIGENVKRTQPVQGYTLDKSRLQRTLLFHLELNVSSDGLIPFLIKITCLIPVTIVVRMFAL